MFIRKSLQYKYIGRYRPEAIIDRMSRVGKTDNFEESRSIELHKYAEQVKQWEKLFSALPMTKESRSFRLDELQLQTQYFGSCLLNVLINKNSRCFYIIGTFHEQIERITRQISRDSYLRHNPTFIVSAHQEKLFLTRQFILDVYHHYQLNQDDVYDAYVAMADAARHAPYKEARSLKLLTPSRSKLLEIQPPHKITFQTRHRKKILLGAAMNFTVCVGLFVASFFFPLLNVGLAAHWLLLSASIAIAMGAAVGAALGFIQERNKVVSVPKKIVSAHPSAQSTVELAQRTGLVLSVDSQNSPDEMHNISSGLHTHATSSQISHHEADLSGVTHTASSSSPSTKKKL